VKVGGEEFITQRVVKKNTMNTRKNQVATEFFDSRMKKEEKKTDSRGNPRIRVRKKIFFVDPSDRKKQLQREKTGIRGESNERARNKRFKSGAV